jgi:Putative restriction endonuclease
MIQTILKFLTLEEFLQLPETKPAREFINGQIIQKPMPQGKHSAIQGDFVPAVNQALRTSELPALSQNFAARLEADRSSLMLLYSPGNGFNVTAMAKLPIDFSSPPTGQLKSSLPTKAKPKSFATSCIASIAAPKWAG